MEMGIGVGIQEIGAAIFFPFIFFPYGKLLLGFLPVEPCKGAQDLAFFFLVVVKLSRIAMESTASKLK